MTASGPPERNCSDEPIDEGPSRRIPWLSVLGAAVALLALYCLITFIDVWLTSRSEYEPANDTATIRAAVVLGAAQYNGEPSPVLKARLDKAAGLYESGEVALVVVTGGGQEADITTEAKSGYDYLRETSGIPDESLRLEVHGSSTYESLAATSRFLRRDDVVEVVLVTDRYHAKRAMLTADEVGLSSQVALTSQPPSFRRLVRESGAVALGRIISFRRLDQF